MCRDRISWRRISRSTLLIASRSSSNQSMLGKPVGLSRPVAIRVVGRTVELSFRKSIFVGSPPFVDLSVYTDSIGLLEDEGTAGSD